MPRSIPREIYAHYIVAEHLEVISWGILQVMEDQELRQKFEALEKKTEAVFQSAEKTRRYLLWALIGSAAAFLLPLVGLFFAIPSFLSTYGDLGGL